MSNNVKINYVNRSTNRDMPKIFLFLENEIPALDTDTVLKADENTGNSRSVDVANDVQE